MKYTTITIPEISVSIRLAAFEKPGSGEFHAMIEGTDPHLAAATQYATMQAALEHLTKKVLPPKTALVMKRWFVSDAANHEAFLCSDPDPDVAVSIVQQPPLNGTKVSMWVWFVERAEMLQVGENSVVMSHGSYRHHFDTQRHNHNQSEFTQTEEIFVDYTDRLRDRGLTLAGNCVRTWIFVAGVDVHYAGMVMARKLFFDEQGLTEHTHYIASTGIEGKYLHPETTVLMDAYAVEGIVPGQITWLKGSTHLNPTHEYGVTFERATAVDYGDRRHIFVSGTASIDNHGQIVHPFDVIGQTERTIENIEVLLAEGGGSLGDVAQMIVYLRDTADYGSVSARLEQICPDTPRVVVWAPVCRPGWLIEIECIAIKETADERYAAF
jgi:enamine deaminase RidA (YjgF/YER057c/UK114 family)